LTPRNETFAQSSIIKELKHLLKKKGIVLKRRFSRDALSTEEEPKRLLASISKHVIYILNSHHSLHSKLQDIFLRYSRKKSMSQKDEDGEWRTLEEVHLEESRDHGVGLNMSEQGAQREGPSSPQAPPLEDDLRNCNRFRKPSIKNYERFGDETKNCCQT